MMILLVEDSDELRSMEARLLCDAGHEVVEAANGVEALAKLSGIVYDVILLDLMMPDMDGWEFLAALRSRPAPVCNTPVIVVTASAVDTVVSLKCMNVAEVLHKPMNLSHLLNTINAVGKTKLVSN